ncbi:MAG: hypothetical protein P1P64_08525 [Treponemataceae bacterium]
MIKKCITIVFLILCVLTQLFAGPFGFKMGMTLDEIADVCGGSEPKHFKNNIFYILPEKTHPLFDYYAVYVDENYGLYCIKAMSSEIKSNRYGREIQNAFTEVTDRIAKVYGKPKIIDELDPNSIYRDDDEWLYAFQDGSRILAAVWEKSNKMPLKDNLMYVCVQASPIKSYLDEGIIVLEYTFANISAVIASQDEVF